MIADKILNPIKMAQILASKPLDHKSKGTVYALERENMVTKHNIR